MDTSTVIESRPAELTARLAALADPVRLRIVGVLAGGTRCVCDLRATVPVAANLLSYHLRVLRDTGLVTASRRGRWIDYRLDPDGFAALWGERPRRLAPARRSRHRRAVRARLRRGGGGPVTSIKTGRTGAAAPGAGEQRAVLARLSRLDRFLPVWIGVAMAAGLLLGRLVPGLNSALNRVAIHGTSLPIALGLLLMMYPCWPRSATPRSGGSLPTGG